ncbi:ABC transporter ATP-binding protein [Prosthecomicrobium pneumaticum]|uniref:ATP-binding cassette subfamily B protein n=1 Tax=Prosthecomicrobium pneumaticum TaxID=81895 RepID=A0A7W9L2H0_9HYPH|nr:ABC transporter ATP-binding protein [Prosthecomicrobium pneumaticum]MBB5753519.1 ATP-binding cassette subfamily B protein [Prosthecomicrobium pneumaticum]
MAKAADDEKRPKRLIDRWRRFKQNGSLETLIRIVATDGRAHMRGYALATVLLVVVGMTTAASAWIMRDVVNHIFVSRDPMMLWILSAAVIGIFVVKGLASWAQAIVLGRVGNRIVAETQRRFYDSFLRFGLDFFTERASSELINTVVRGAGAIRSVLDTVIMSLARDLVSLISLVAVMLWQAPLMSLAAFTVAPIAIFFVTGLIKRMRKIAQSEYGASTMIVALVQETVYGNKVVKAFGLDHHMRGRMAETIAAVEQRQNKMASLQARTSPLMETLGGVSIAAVIFYAGWNTINFGTSPGEFMSFVTALLLAYEPAKRLARVQIGLEMSLVGARAMYEILDKPPSGTERDDEPALDFSAGRIELRDVDFAYRKGEPVLKGVSFVVERGERIALVGPSGGGKSTIIALIQRFYDATAGAVLVDGQDVRKVAVSSLRRHIASVSQDVFLFSGTVRDNIRLGRLSATDEEVEEAARDAYAFDFIANLPKGFDTDIGENGVQLSGGQRQRLAIARAILKDAPILLLDEATSALDSESERNIQLALDRLVEGRTSVVIAHRLSTILNADRIVVIDRGEVVDIGTHAELLRRGGLYAMLYRYQFSEEKPLVAAQ